MTFIFGFIHLASAPVTQCEACNVQWPESHMSRIRVTDSGSFYVATATSYYGGPHLPRQNLLFHGKTYFSTAKLTFSRQNLLFHGKTYFSTAKLTFPRQNLLFYGKTYFLTAKLTFPRQNLLFYGKTYFSIPSFQSVSAYAFPRWRSGNFQQSNMADGEKDYV